MQDSTEDILKIPAHLLRRKASRKELQEIVGPAKIPDGEIQVDLIKVGERVRKDFGNLVELAGSP